MRPKSLSLGLDTYEGDPLKGFRVTADAFTDIGGAIARLALPTVLVQEGGYPCEELGGNLTRFLAGFEAAHVV